MANMDDLMGLTFTEVRQGSCGYDGNDGIIMTVDDGRVFTLTHHQDCCESVSIEDVVGDLQDLVGSPILESEESYHGGEVESGYGDSFTWSYYKLGTIKGHVNIRFYGSSNGYYSESASLYLNN